MTEIDIERLRDLARNLADTQTDHWSPDDDPYFGSAVLELIERLKKSEAQRDRLRIAVANMRTCGNYSEGCNCSFCTDLRHALDDVIERIDPR